MSDIVSLLNYSDVFPTAKYGYEDFIGLKRNNLGTEGPVLQYINGVNENTDFIILPAKGFRNAAEQIAIYDQKLIGEGYDTTSFKYGKLSYKPQFEVPIFCDSDNVPAPYVFHLFDLTRKAPYGDAVEHVCRISTVSGTTLVLNSNGKYLCQLLKNNLLSSSRNIYVTIVDGRTLIPLSSRVLVSSISVSTITITASSAFNASLSGGFYLAVFAFYQGLTYAQPLDTPPNRQNYETSNEFYLASSRDGVYYPCLVDKLDFSINNDMPTLNISTVSKRTAQSDRSFLFNELTLPQGHPLYSIPKLEQARLKITSVSGQTLFYGLTPAVQSGTIYQESPYLSYRSGVDYGADIDDLTNPNPLLIKSLSISISNNLVPLYTTHTPRFSILSDDDDMPKIRDLSRYDNSCAYAFYSIARKIEGTITFAVPSGDWFQKQILPAINSSTEGAVEIDTGYLNFSMNNLVYNLSSSEGMVNSEYDREAHFSFVSIGYDSMFEIGISKTGGRL